MPEPSAIPSNSQNQYFATNKSVNVQDTLKAQANKNNNGLNGVEVRSAPPKLGKDDFLKLLVTQLTYQDPTSPVKDQQFIAQMAQFSSLEQMQNMAQSLGQLADRQAHSLIGRYVKGPDFVSGEVIGGTVQALFYDNENKAFLKVGGRAIALNKVQLIGDESLIKRSVSNPQDKPAKSSGNGITHPQNKPVKSSDNGITHPQSKIVTSQTKQSATSIIQKTLSKEADASKLEVPKK